MDKILAMTGATGRKSGGVFADYIALNINAINEKFPGGIRALTRMSSYTDGLEKKIPGIEIVRTDFENQKNIDTALNNVDTLVHIAGITLSPKIIKSAAKNHVRRVILVHTTGIYSKYKAAGETYRHIDEFVYKICQKYNILLTILRPTMIYGNITDNNVCVFIKMIDRLPIMPVVNGARYGLSPVNYKDLGKAYYQVLINENTSGHDYILSGGNSIDLRDICIVIGRNLGKKVRFVSVPYPIAYAGACGLWTISLGKIDYREKVQRLCEPRVFGHEEAKKDFGYDPVDFKTGIVDEVKEYLKANKS